MNLFRFFPGYESHVFGAGREPARRTSAEPMTRLSVTVQRTTASNPLRLLTHQPMAETRDWAPFARIRPRRHWPCAPGSVSGALGALATATLDDGVSIDSRAADSVSSATTRFLSA